MNQIKLLSISTALLFLTSGHAQAFAPIPVDEPATLIIFAAGLLGLLLRHFMRKK